MEAFAANSIKGIAHSRLSSLRMGRITINHQLRGSGR